jgi:methyltransferase-like protein/SAM-dependent methyltransferase
MDTYDEIPYESLPFSDAHPVNLAALGRLFGLEAPDPEYCQVLELGCATGGNLIPLAWYHPGSHFIGIERSSSHVASGEALISRLGLSNIAILKRDILRLNDDLGEFDYILVHGVYSWVPEPVRERIMQLCAKHLSPTGIAYISYNTLPGWRMRGMLRDMFLFHTRNALRPQEKVARVQTLLPQLDVALEKMDTDCGRYLKREIAYLRATHPSYLYHEYLEDINTPFLFSHFMEDAHRHKLQYLCDVDLKTIFPSTLGEAAENLVEAFDDLIEQEQYSDFIRNRYFRQSLLCHDDQAITHEIDLEVFERFAFYSDLSPQKEVSLSDSEQTMFISPARVSFPASHPLTKAALIYLWQNYPDSLPFETVTRNAREKVIDQGGNPYANQTNQFIRELFNLYVHQAIGASPRAQQFFNQLTPRPRATRLAQVQAYGNLGHLATARHSVIQLDAFSTRLVTYLDGRLTGKELAEHLTQDVLKGDLPLFADDKKLPAAEQVNTQIAENCERLLQLLAFNGVLEG